MFYIRTDKNKYNIDVIIDVCDNVEFVNSTNLPWIEVDVEKKPENGNYYYDGKIISIGSDDYSIIENIIFEYEEPLREERDKNLPIIPEEDDNLENIFDIVNENNQILPPEKPPEITEEQKQEILQLERPKLNTYDEVESNQENLELFEFGLENIGRTISAYDSGNFTFSDNEVVFNPPIEYSNGQIEEKVIIPLSISLEEQIQHLKNQREQMIILIDRIKKDLQILD